MTTTINASPTNGIVQTADGSGVMKLQSNGVTTNALAWVNFNGTGTVAIRSSYNVSSITDNGVGRYVINFTNALADTNYAAVMGCCDASATAIQTQRDNGTKTTTTCGVNGLNAAGSSFQDLSEINVAIFGN